MCKDEEIECIWEELLCDSYVSFWVLFGSGEFKIEQRKVMYKLQCEARSTYEHTLW